MHISHQYWKSLYCEWFFLLLKAISLDNEVEYLPNFLLLSNVIVIKNENQREGFKSVSFSQGCRK